MSLDNKGSTPLNYALGGFISYLEMISYMINKVKYIKEKYDFDGDKLKEDNYMQNLFVNSPPEVVGELVITIMKYMPLLKNPMDNIDAIDPETLKEFDEAIKSLKGKIGIGEVSND